MYAVPFFMIQKAEKCLIFEENAAPCFTGAASDLYRETRFSATKEPLAPFPAGRAYYTQAGLLTCAGGKGFLPACSPAFPGTPGGWLSPAESGSGAYSGGTVREFHPVLYSPPETGRPRGHLRLVQQGILYLYGRNLSRNRRQFCHLRLGLPWIYAALGFTKHWGCGIMAPAGRLCDALLKNGKRRVG